MTHIEKGTKLQDFTFNTPYESDVKLSDAVKGKKKTVILFLRYFGCTLCQLDLREYANQYSKFADKDAQVLIALQSPPATINAQVKKGELPYTIICDPDQGIYKTFELGVAASKETMIKPEEAPKFMEKKAKIAEYGMSHGAYEGEEMQLPGFFIVDADLNVLEAHRAATILDMPSIDEMATKI